MNVRKIELRNFRSYEHIELELPDGSTALIGPNGAGKSSILTAIEVALFGAASLEPYLRRGAERLEVTLALEHAGRQYRLRRGFHGRSSLDFEEQTLRVPITLQPDPDAQVTSEWHPLTLETQKATQQLIEETLGLTRATFRASAYLAQGDAAAITNARPAERMAILRDTIGGLELYEHAHDRAKALHRGSLADGDKLAGVAETLEATLAGKPAALAEQEALAEDEARDAAELETAGTIANEADEALQAARAQIAERLVLGLEHKAAAAQAAALDTLEADGRKAQVALDGENRRAEGLVIKAAHEPQLADQVEKLTELLARHEREQASYESRLRERDGLLAQAESRLELAAALRRGAQDAEEAGPGEARCSECDQLLGAEALARSVGTRREQATDYMAHHHDLKQRAAAIDVSEPVAAPAVDALRATRDALHDARTAANQLGIVRDRIERLREAVAAIESDDFRRTLEEARAREVRARSALEGHDGSTDPLGLPTLERSAGMAQREADAARRRLEAVRRRVAVVEDRLETLAEDERRLRATEAARQLAEREAAVLSVVAEMFAPTGIPLLVIENAVPLVEERAQDVLEQLGGQTAGCRVELRTQRANKADGALRDTLDIVIHTPAGDPVPYEQWSGGERMRLDLAIRVGLAQLLLVNGANVELFAVDEPDGLDAQGRAALVEVIEGMADRYGFRKVLLISHDETLRDALPQALEVVRQDDGASKVLA